MRDHEAWIQRECRGPTSLAAFVSSATIAEHQGLITNVSTRGCKIEAPHRFKVGDLVVIRIPRLGRISALIRWVQAGRAGAEYISDSCSWEIVEGDPFRRGAGEC